MRHRMLRATCAIATALGMLVFGALPAGALDVNNPPQWVRDSIWPVQPTSAADGLNPAHPTASAMGGVHEVTPSSSTTAGLQPVTGGRIIEEMNRLKPEDTQAQQLLLTWRNKLERRELDRESLSQLITAQDIASETLVGVLNSLPLAHPMDPLYLPVCEVLWQRSEEDIETCLQLPYAPRIYMATYLGTIDREDDAKTLLSSLENPDKMALGADYYHIANELAFYRGETPVSPRLAIWAWKTGSTFRGAADQAFVCSHIAQTCRRMDDPLITTEELIPWAEEALARSGSEARWKLGLLALLWAYGSVGEYDHGVERGLHWLTKAKERGIPQDDLIAPERRLARLCEKAGRLDEAAMILPPAFGGMSPRKLSLPVRMGATASYAVQVWGNATLMVTGATCELPTVNVQIGDKIKNGADMLCEMQLTFGPMEELGAWPTILVIETNDPEQPQVELPIVVTCRPPVHTEHPGGLFFRDVDGGTQSAAKVRLTSALPFDARVTEVVPTDLVEVDLVREDDSAYSLKARLQAHEQSGTWHGYVKLRTTLEAQPEIMVPLIVHVQVAAQ